MKNKQTVQRNSYHLNLLTSKEDIWFILSELLPYVTAPLEQRNDSNKSGYSLSLTSKPPGVHTTTLRPKQHALGRIHSCSTSGGPNRLRIWKNLGLHFQEKFHGVIKGSHVSLDAVLISCSSFAFLWLPRI